MPKHTAITLTRVRSLSKESITATAMTVISMIFVTNPHRNHAHSAFSERIGVSTAVSVVTVNHIHSKIMRLPWTDRIFRHPLPKTKEPAIVGTATTSAQGSSYAL